MIERNDRLVVFAEFSGGSPDWYAPAYDVSADDVAEDPTLTVRDGAMQETPFQVDDPGAFTCEESRGSSDDGPLPSTSTERGRPSASVMATPVEDAAARGRAGGRGLT